MARSRNIKPGFFLNDELVELPFSTRLLFIGLWCLADREGRLENRPKKIKMQLFPADDLDLSKALLGLYEAGFLSLYSIDSIDYIQISKFNKHQNPHHKEAASTIPAPDSTRSSPSKDVLIPDTLNLIPDTLNLIPDTLNLIPETVAEPPKPKQKRFVEPSLEEVRFYFFDKGETQSEEPQRFHDYYTSNGWKVSNNKMKCWKASARGWISRNASKGNYNAQTNKREPVDNSAPAQVRRAIAERDARRNASSERAIN